ncbi:glutamate--tRNA ligase [Buchnera aphidicola (Nipponaphis monzeni)]|uniref:Glutamate--tRNA ligase n=1 Tax=Buchnera aphidicola (Nipponaphis monzeni) TaxID=2495405 RepID=A0A455T9S2_9GAMM|nr:glutamate--tRNA ligase [Buchnera aphidicola]BBI01072.1 glutamate--tRNA ligase [Buchnera aphidicola (Nipponaphis monzeni)]
MTIITRFAPSPTGNIHIGNIRTALYSWLFARKHKGLFILRFEDTDIKRCTTKSKKEILNVLKWLGLTWDKGPFYQSDRLKYYKKLINLMLKTGNAYKCYCSTDRLLKLRQSQIIKKEKTRYDGQCRNILNVKKMGLPFIIRFKNPTVGYVIFEDEIKGLIKINNNELDDLVIQRSNGMPTYNFCVVADDIDMNITHVIRGEDHISNTPRQINIYKALKQPIPKYVHLSMILDANGKKISKRENSEHIIKYYNEGYLPEALLNYIVRLGWSYGNKEIFSLQEMQNLFSLKSITGSSSRFNIKKLVSLNRYYIKNLSLNNLVKYLNIYLLKNKINVQNGPCLLDIIDLVRNKCNTLTDIISVCNYFYRDNINLKLINCEKNLTNESIIPLKIIFSCLNNLNNWNIIQINKIIFNLPQILGIKIQKIGMPLRIAVTGTNISASIDKIIFYIGKKRTLYRIKQALIFIINNKNKKLKKCKYI